MSTLEINKIFAALLTVGIITGFSMFLASVIMHPDALEEPVYLVAGAVSEDAPAADEPADDLAAMMAAADEAAGLKVAKKCTACHTFEQGGANKVGPNLWNTLDQPIADAEGFGYSDVLTGMAGDSWTYDSLNAFIKKPADFAPGTKMSFAGLRKTEDRANLIMYMRSMSDSPAALPEPSAATASDADPAEGAETEAAAEGAEAEAAAEGAEAEAAAEGAEAEAAAEGAEAEAAAEGAEAEAAAEGAEAEAAAEGAEAEAAAEGTEAEAAAEGAEAEAAAEGAEAEAAANGAAGDAPASELVAMLASADEAAGEKVAKKCTACHTFDQGGANKIGPNLWNIVDRPIASVEGFKYSDALQGMSSDAWTYDSLDAFMKKPKDFAPGTKMSFPGIRKVEDRANLIVYMRSMSDSPAALPE